jgi:hypothetical protein
MTMKQGPLTDEHLEPWNGNIVDLTMADGSHRTGLLQRIDRTTVRLRPVPGAPAVPDGGIVRIADATSVARASRN